MFSSDHDVCDERQVEVGRGGGGGGEEGALEGGGAPCTHTTTVMVKLS